MNKWYMYKVESILQNETYKFLWDFKIQNKSPNLAQTTRPNESKKKIPA